MGVTHSESLEPPVEPPLPELAPGVPVPSGNFTGSMLIGGQGAQEGLEG